ncbi:WAT1-related protein At5g47470-like [Phragmites australis]|uniref:WAT1-related protein At5g47470-like n=1 Tax=Phragmites australis TaxID=29695 RepID=UPI002D7A1D27|nr:WAT1-related protein At5g47470-like [Phragmites australis]
MVSQGGGGGFLEDVLIVGGLLLLQCVLAGYVVFVHHLLGLGADPLAVIVVAGASSSAFFLPFAVTLERKKWPSKISATLVAQFVLIALGGTTVFQELMLLGIKKTTPAIASAMPNLGPGLVFTVAACFRLEKFDKACKYTPAKILGTLVCLVGAMAMSFLHSPSDASSPGLQASAPLTITSSELPRSSSYYGWILGCSYLFLATIVFSCYTVLLAATLMSFPAPLTMCTITSAIGAVFTAVLQVAVEGKIDMGSPKIGAALISGIVILGGVLAGACVVFQTWCLGKKGPLFVSVFGPVQTVCSAILSAALFGQTVSLGSLTGMVLMFCGLYIVLWAKNNENPREEDGDDAEKALLS